MATAAQGRHYRRQDDANSKRSGRYVAPADWICASMVRSNHSSISGCKCPLAIPGWLETMATRKPRSFSRRMASGTRGRRWNWARVNGESMTPAS